ncbi:MAG: UDP-N-acetylmuramate--L-alanine ligase [Candidatus Viridilinea halotolerans]|uniref:UDP-N-acetylmuramate--L-alanine ligase n=1 Tax=Candidatus Viridilinea halotolerans TaxID=2491704 RepID=A0A426U260_9CHLR|nr:MAG: UDP-N-acetylmuramate--L-alanine ligase [Candidatus Viridilinea halotolerans]
MVPLHYHIVGIAGAGMSAIAHLLLDQGQRVSGSDVATNRQTAALAARGATIYQGHAPDHVVGADRLLASAAVPRSHMELEAARAAGIPVIGRAELWRAWSQQRPVAAVAGTHGKTTTSALLAVALRAGGVPAGYLIGAEVPDLGGSAAWGDPAAPLVIEADEYDRVFLALTPDVALITNVEWDHPDIYPSREAYHAAFAQFAAQVAAPSRVMLCGDDAGALALNLPEAALYGIEERLAHDPASCRLAPYDWTASGVEPTAMGGFRFDLWRYNRQRMAQQRLGTQVLALTGAHNVRNALGALAVAHLLGADLAAAAAAIANFRGTARRFELQGEAGGVVVVDDYAHHPTEVRATLAAARDRYPQRRIVAYLQPHTFSRTTSLREAWATAGEAADLLLVGDVYAAREQGDAAATSRDLVELMQAAGLAAHYVGPVAAAGAALVDLVRPGDLVLTLGAGDGDTVGRFLLEQRAIS